MTSITRRRALAIGAALPLSACALPRGAPIQREIFRSARPPDFAIRRVTRDTLPELTLWPRIGDPPNAGWISTRGGPAEAAIAPGDVLGLKIWETGENALLTAPNQTSADLQGLIVDNDGTIFLPYLGDVRVAGLTPNRARSQIQNEMAFIIPSAQVQLVREAGRMNSVDVVGGVSRPGRYPLVERGTTLLNVLSQAGGVPENIDNPLVRLVREGSVYLTSLERLYNNPTLDTVLLGGDKVIVESDDRFFIALGATGREEFVYFNKDRLTALEALSLAGGLSDTRADPRGLLILRTYPLSALGQRPGPSQERVVFVFDLTTADGLFSAEAFEVRPSDVLLATESPVTSTQTVIGLVANTLRVVTSFDDL